jgi:hypothetical protein
MKKNQNRTKFNFGNGIITTPSLMQLKRFVAKKGKFNFDVIPFIKIDNEKLQIVYANIRV